MTYSSEARLVYEIQVALGADPRVRLFRNNVGQGKDAFGRFVKFGLVKGAADFVGIVKPRGRFLALECKSQHGRLTAEQVTFLAMINSFGGIGREIRTVTEACAAVDEAAL